MKVTMTLDVDERRWYALALLAEGRGLGVADLLAPEVREALVRLTTRADGTVPDERGPNPYAKDRPYVDPTHREAIRRLWVGGHSSVAIGARLGTTNLRKVRATLWDLGFDTRERIGRPAAGGRPRPVHLSADEKASVAA